MRLLNTGWLHLHTSEMCLTAHCTNSIYGVCHRLKGFGLAMVFVTPLLKTNKKKQPSCPIYIILSFVSASRALCCHPWRETSPKYGQKCTISIHPSFQITIFSTPNSGTHHDNFICCNAFTRVNL